MRVQAVPHEEARSLHIATFSALLIASLQVTGFAAFPGGATKAFGSDLSKR